MQVKVKGRNNPRERRVALLAGFSGHGVAATTTVALCESPCPTTPAHLPFPALHITPPACPASCRPRKLRQSGRRRRPARSRPSRPGRQRMRRRMRRQLTRPPSPRCRRRRRKPRCVVGLCLCGGSSGGGGGCRSGPWRHAGRLAPSLPPPRPFPCCPRSTTAIPHVPHPLSLLSPCCRPSMRRCLRPWLPTGLRWRRARPRQRAPSPSARRRLPSCRRRRWRCATAWRPCRRSWVSWKGLAGASSRPGALCSRNGRQAGWPALRFFQGRNLGQPASASATRTPLCSSALLPPLLPISAVEITLFMPALTSRCPRSCCPASSCICRRDPAVCRCRHRARSLPGREAGG